MIFKVSGICFMDVYNERFHEYCVYIYALLFAFVSCYSEIWVIQPQSPDPMKSYMLLN